VLIKLHREIVFVLFEAEAASHAAASVIEDLRELNAAFNLFRFVSKTERSYVDLTLE